VGKLEFLPPARASPIAGSLDLFQGFDGFKEQGSFFEGFQLVPRSTHRFQAFKVLKASRLAAPQRSCRQGLVGRPTARRRSPSVPCVPVLVMLSGTDSFMRPVAWNYDQLTLTQLATGASDSPFLWRFGWAAGTGVEFPVLPHWAARFEYLFTDYGFRSVTFPTAVQRSDSNFVLQEFRAGLNSQFDATLSDNGPLATLWPDSDRINFHAQSTLVEQAYLTFRSPYVGPIVYLGPGRAARPGTQRSIPASGCGRVPNCGSTRKSIKEWVWRRRTGVAGFPSAESYKLGFDYPYARVQRAFVRQTIDLGGNPKRSRPTSISSPARGRRTASCRRSEGPPSSTYLTPTNMPTIPKPIS
jgi:high affinity Mn2+ porin